MGLSRFGAALQMPLNKWLGAALQMSSIANAAQYRWLFF